MGIPTLKLVRCLVALTLYAVTTVVIYVFHARYFRVDVVFYSALQDVLIATAVSALAMWLLPYFRVLSAFERLQTAVIMLLAGYCFAITVPTVIDRSLSLYLLERIQRSGGGIRHDALENLVLTQFMREYRVMDARMTEQLQSGTIVIRGDCVLLTDKGKRLAYWTSSIRENFLPKHRLLLDEYSDALASPLAEAGDSDFACQ